MNLPKNAMDANTLHSMDMDMLASTNIIAITVIKIKNKFI
jgi:hypothetical protein